ncbi:MAG: MaoC/PaaZ C-terminal domain-containing protein [Myxococcota bacterium]
MAKITDVKVGDALPDLDVPLTTAIIVGGAIASRDYTPVHHDKAAAQASGMSDVFMNILTTNGYVGRYVTDWAGPDARLEKVAIKLGTPNTPGDTMKLRGEIAAVDAANGTVEVSVVAKNAWGDHATGTVTVALPS